MKTTNTYSLNFMIIALFLSNALLFGCGKKNNEEPKPTSSVKSSKAVVQHTYPDLEGGWATRRNPSTSNIVVEIKLNGDLIQHYPVVAGPKSHKRIGTLRGKGREQGRSTVYDLEPNYERYQKAKNVKAFPLTITQNGKFYSIDIQTLWQLCKMKDPDPKLNFGAIELHVGNMNNMIRIYSREIKSELERIKRLGEKERAEIINKRKSFFSHLTAKKWVMTKISRIDDNGDIVAETAVTNANKDDINNKLKIKFGTDYFELLFEIVKNRGIMSDDDTHYVYINNANDNVFFRIPSDNSSINIYHVDDEKKVNVLASYSELKVIKIDNKNLIVEIGLDRSNDTVKMTYSHL